MKRVKYASYLVLLGLVLSGQMLLAQDRDSLVLDYANRLKEGLLIVRLDMKTNVIESYEDVLQNSNLSEKEYKRTEEKLKEVKAGRKKYKENFKEAMEGHYYFSDYCFLESNDVKEYLQGNHELLQCPKEIDFEALSENQIFFLIKGKVDSHMIIADNNFDQLPYPFPSSHNIGAKRLFDFLSKKDNFRLPNLIKTIQMMQIKLDKALLR